MNCSTPGLPVHHQLPEFTQTHVHRVRDAIHPSHPLSSPLLLPPIPPSIRVSSNESILRMRWPKYWSFSFIIIPSKEIPGLISIRMDWLDLLAVQGTLESSPAPQFKWILYCCNEGIPRVVIILKVLGENPFLVFPVSETTCSLGRPLYCKMIHLCCQSP